MYHIFICESSERIYREIVPCTKAYAKTLQTEISVIQGTPVDNAFAVEQLAEASWFCDIIILEEKINAHLSGIEIAQELRKRGCIAEIIFITDCGKDIQKGYDVEALHYLLLPEDRGKIAAVLKKALERCETKSQASIVVKYDDVIRKISLSEIVYIESNKNYVLLHGIRETYRDRKKLDVYEQRLSEHPGYLRIHQSFAVHIMYVVKYERTSVTLYDGTILPVSRARSEEVRERMHKLSEAFVVKAMFFNGS